MPPALRQFVPSRVCLKCDGCCRFSGGDSPWRPAAAAEERLAVALSAPGAVTAASFSPDGRIATRSRGSGPGCRCEFFRPAEGTCAVYAGRPFECRFYPFLLGSFHGRIKVGVHLSCPYVQEHWKDESMTEYVEYLKEYCRRPEVGRFLRRNPGWAAEYSAFARKGEVEELFDVDSAEPAAAVDGDLLDGRPALEAALDSGPRPLSEFAFAAIAGWQDHFRFRAARLDDGLAVFASGPAGTFLYLPPLGTAAPAAAAARALRLMAAVNAGSGVSRIENVPLGLLHHFPESEYVRRRKGAEYIYRRSDIVALAGGPYKSKRHDDHYAVGHFAPRFLPYAPAMAGDCAALLDEWIARRKDAADGMSAAMLDDSRTLHRLALARPAELGLSGRVAVVDGCVRGYTFGYRLNDDTFCVLLEIVDVSARGLPVFVFRRFCADPEVLPCAFVNVMGDCGVAAMASAKNSFRPVAMTPSYIVTPRETAG